MKKENIYLISFWSSVYFPKRGVNPEMFHQVVVDISHDWWHYMADLYIIATTRKARWVSRKIREKQPQLPFIVLEIGNYTGQLPKDSWSWLQKHGRKPL